jgi:hypothetical protein
MVYLETHVEIGVVTTGVLMVVAVVNSLLFSVYATVVTVQHITVYLETHVEIGVVTTGVLMVVAVVNSLLFSVGAAAVTVQHITV